jgi:hypothetical protein
MAACRNGGIQPLLQRMLEPGFSPSASRFDGTILRSEKQSLTRLEVRGLRVQEQAAMVEMMRQRADDTKLAEELLVSYGSPRPMAAHLARLKARNTRCGIRSSLLIGFARRETTAQ